MDEGNLEPEEALARAVQGKDLGPGVDRDGAWDLAVELAERTGATVWVSPVSSRCSFPEDHPNFAGFLTPSRRMLAGQLGPHDVVVVLGAPISRSPKALPVYRGLRQSWSGQARPRGRSDGGRYIRP